MDNAISLSGCIPSLPADWYFDDTVYRRELAAIWQRSWVYVCHRSRLEKRRMFRTLTVGRQSLVVLRDDTGSLRAFYNTCRHRGTALCAQSSGTLASKLLVCPYHQWSYSIDDGRLINTSSFALPAGFNKADYPLYQAAVKEWRGCIFVNFKPDAVWDDEAVFQRSAAGLSHFPLEKMRCGHRWKKTVKCNWKSFWENFNECLHCPGVHPELVDLVPLYSRRIVSVKDIPGWEKHAHSDDPKYTGGLRPGAQTWSEDGSAQGRVISTLDRDDLATGQRYASAWPGLFIGAYADHVRTVRILPTQAEEMELCVEWLFEEETLNDARYDRNNVVSFARRVLEQDGRACELNQQGLHATPFKHGVLMPEEYWLHYFHEWVRAQLVAEHQDCPE